jgi:hypothetical protein
MTNFGILVIITILSGKPELETTSILSSFLNFGVQGLRINWKNMTIFVKLGTLFGVSDFYLTIVKKYFTAL